MSISPRASPIGFPALPRLQGREIAGALGQRAGQAMEQCGPRSPGDTARHAGKADHEREVPRHDQPHDAERLAEGHVDPAGDRDGLSQQPLRGACVVPVRSGRPSPSRRARRRSACPRCAPPEVARSPACSSSASARRCSSAARSPGDHRAPGWERALARATAASSLLGARARHLGHHLLGRRLDDGEIAWSSSRARTCGGARSPSPPRRTAAAPVCP